MKIVIYFIVTTSHIHSTYKSKNMFIIIIIIIIINIVSLFSNIVQCHVNEQVILFIIFK